MPDLLATLVEPLPGLGPEIRPQALEAEAVAALASTWSAGLEPRRAELLEACLLLWHDRLEAAHAIVQRHEGDREADCLHAIMHRREPDEDNSCYWWARAGIHPVAPALAAEAGRLGLASLVGADGAFLPKAMTRACCRASLPLPALAGLQGCELRLLAGHLLAP